MKKDSSSFPLSPWFLHGIFLLSSARKVDLLSEDSESFSGL